MAGKPNVPKVVARRRLAQRLFLRAYEGSLSVRAAARVIANIKMPQGVVDELTKHGQMSFQAVSIERRHARWYERDPWYREQFDKAKEKAVRKLEDVAYDRAVNGTLKPVWYKGEQVGTEIEYSDTLMALILRGAMPEKYNRRDVDVKHSGEIEHKTTFVVHRADPAALPEREAENVIDADAVTSEADGP